MTNIEYKLMQLGLWVIENRSTFGDIDGDLQDYMEDIGLLISVKAIEPCGTDCTCAEFGDFPQDCLRLNKQVTQLKNELATRGK